MLRSIYKTEPIGGQSRAAGTGGSTPPFLKLFLDQTILPARKILLKLYAKKELLSDDELAEINDFHDKFDQFESLMSDVRNKGILLEFDEEISNAH